MLLNELFKGAPAIEINQLSCDSRMPMKDAIFFCVKGVRDDGHQFVKDAIINGAKVIVYEDDIDTSLNAVFIRVNSVLDVLAKVADKFYDYPGKALETFVILGCYGRSSIASYIRQLITPYKRCGSIGIMGIEYGARSLMSSYPTLPLLSNCSYMAQMRRDGVEACVFESSPLNLSLKKLVCTDTNVFVYSNTSKYASDYREVGSDYFNLLRKYFYTLEEDAIVLLNRDDDSYEELYDSVGTCATYGFDERSDFMVYDVSYKTSGTSFGLRYKGKNVIISCPLLGRTNVYNLTAAVAALTLRGYDLTHLAVLCADVRNIEGIYEPLKTDRFHIVIDSAYTLDCIENIFQYARSVTSRRNKIVAVIGINYTDDSRRIESLLQLAQHNIDFLIVTEDDSYEHEPLTILERINEYPLSIRRLIIEERKTAIEEGIELLNEGDTLLILGKGNEVSLYKGLGKEYYEGDRNVAMSYLKKREEEEHETFEVY